MKTFCSWSGGKDSTLALYHGLKKFKVDYLFTMLSEDGIHSRAHGLPKSILEKQANSIGIPLITKCSTWGEYEKNFLDFLEEYAKGGMGIFGDIDLQEHLDWVENVCNKKNVRVFEPLWRRNRREIVEEFLKLGFKAKIIAVKKDLNIEKYLGKDLSFDLISEFESIGIDACGENGEFHTFVYNGPIFKNPVDFEIGTCVEKSKNLVLEIK
ncbi:ATP-binding protein [Thermosipho melanesiensis]|uniref:ATP-binding protein n=2 Tax=Thermosipho melanesiensis TaxID=46541 RepID=A0ABN4UU89_9BACT|nr:diphthine--ammonia ligase [Thermosipho melanesiensis]ABR30580.1 putative ATP binding protein [Thermosipho melanesiensis BI429]APT73728.1 ATP-binding protein [Thermosipho melanesiensis]OOC35666.1 ATP-binding protein [Thermosipho melanesiensis]OOC38965.1 ATP-binding protein [Thermosipho melanesiensis]OOC39113.1 ATP-binding protein [Thermosipho melanesiensis]